MEDILKTLEELGFYTYEEPALVPIIKTLQLSHNSVWIREGIYKQLKAPLTVTNNQLIETCNEFINLYGNLPPHRCFSIDKEDLYEYPPMIFEYQYLCNSLRKCGVIINDIDEYEDEDGNLHLITDVGDFLICPEEFRASYNHAYLKWEAVISHTIKMLNDLLSQTGSDEKFYMLHEESEEITFIVLLNSCLFNFFNGTKELYNI